MKALLLALALLPLGAHAGTIYLCKGNSGTFWAQAHCTTHSARVERTVSVPDGMSFEQQVQVAEECRSLDARVNELDSLARQPQSGAMQDQLRSERKAARDRQFSLRC